MLSKIVHNKEALDLGCDGLYKIAKVLTMRAYKLSCLSEK